jgi:hypothetical protein
MNGAAWPPEGVQAGHPGVNVIIFVLFSPKKLAENDVF